MEPIKTITIFSTKNSTYAIVKSNYRHNKNHIHIWEIDLPEEFVFSDKKRKLKEYIDTTDKLQLWLQKELQKAVDSVR